MLKIWNTDKCFRNERVFTQIISQFLLIEIYDTLIVKLFTIFLKLI